MASALCSSPPWFVARRSCCCRRKASSRVLLLAAAASSTSGYGFRGRPAADVNVMVAGSTGYIGRFVVRELVARGYNVLAISRRPMEEDAAMEGAEVCIADVTRPQSLASALGGRNVDVVVSCLASRGGGVKDSWDIDYAATKNVMEAAKAAGASHLVLLSAVCVQKPLLEFQRAKLKLEAEMQGEMAADGRTSWSIVRPTAFFKSLGGQVGIVKDGGPFVVFGDGRLCSCKPISEADVAAFVADCLSDETLTNRVLPIGGPGKAMTPLEQGELLFSIVGRRPRFIKVPIQIMDGAVAFLGTMAQLIPALEDSAEYARIGRYYAVESMLVMDPVTGLYDEQATPSYGKDTLEEFFKRVVRDGMAGQELGQQAPALFNQQ